MFTLIPLLVLSAFATPAEDSFSGVERIVAVGDVHGDYEAFLTLLRAAEIVDRNEKWVAGKTHLVQTGDILDRGAQSRKVMDLLMSLEPQALKAGGRVHALIGNHESMNIYGDLRYVTPGEFEAFRTSSSEQLRETFWDQQLRQGGSNKPKASARKKWDEEHPLGWVEHRVAFGVQGTYGKWIRTLNTVIRINDSLFLHGGISPKYASTSLTDINQAIRERLSDFSKIQQGDILVGDDSPLWYRGLAQDSESGLLQHVNRVLANFEVKRIVVGHTPTTRRIEARFDGKVIMIDAAMSEYFGRRGSACLVIEGDNVYTLDRGQRRLLGQR